MYSILDLGERFGYPVSNILQPYIDSGKVKLLSEWTDEDDPDLIMFGGGADVHPDIYGHVNICSGVSSQSRRRDNFEVHAFQTALAARIPMIGICRGAQFLNVMCGGKMIQDVKNHGGEHQIIDLDTQTLLQMTSTHHQMMYPWESEYPWKLIAKASPPRSIGYYKYAGTNDMLLSTIEFEPEIVYFLRQQCLCIQGHPEYYRSNHPTAEYVRNLVKQYLLKKLGDN